MESQPEIFMCDASYNNSLDLAIIGYYDSTINQMFHKLHTNVSNTKAEILAIIELMQYISNKNHNKSNLTIKIFTDCQQVINLLNKRDKLVQTNFCNKKGIPLNNGNEYRLFFQNYDLLNSLVTKIIIEHIDGHKKKYLKTDTDYLFSNLDKYVRKILREHFR